MRGYLEHVRDMELQFSFTPRYELLNQQTINEKYG